MGSPAAAAAAAAAAAGYCQSVGGQAAAAAAAAPMFPKLEFRLEPRAALKEGGNPPPVGIAKWDGRSSPPGPQCTNVVPPTAMAVVEPAKFPAVSLPLSLSPSLPPKPSCHHPPSHPFRQP